MIGISWKIHIILYVIFIYIYIYLLFLFYYYYIIIITLLLLLCAYMFNMLYIYAHNPICIYRLVPPLGTTYHGGMGWDVNIHVNLQKQLMLRTRGVGWGEMGWDVNVHVNLQKQLIERGPQSCARLAAPVTRQNPELVSHVSGRGLQTPCSC